MEIVRDPRIEMPACPVARAPDESAAETAKAKPPAVVGVPLMVPFGLSVSPGGSWPEATVQVYGETPPEAESVAEYATPTAPAGSVGELVMVTTAATAMVNCFVAVAPELSCTWRVNVEFPGAVGVPESAPPGVREIPAGSEPDARDQE